MRLGKFKLKRKNLVASSLSFLLFMNCSLSNLKPEVKEGTTCFTERRIQFSSENKFEIWDVIAFSYDSSLYVKVKNNSSFQKFVEYNLPLNREVVNSIIIDSLKYSWKRILIDKQETPEECFYLIKTIDYYFEEEDNQQRYYDLMEIFSLKKGRVGGFLCTEVDGKKIMFRPRGELKRDFFDYSDFTRLNL